MISRSPAGRTPEQLRPLKIEIDVNLYAEGSAIIHAGNTKVLCTASVEENVPKWMEGKGRGWVTGEYSMLPRATHTRSKREREKVSGRTHEIQRLIGRALRSMVNLNALGERSITIDCDVLQADAGTRTASVSGGCVALVLALHKLEKEGKLPPGSLHNVWKDTVAAVSVGMKDGQVLVDLDYNEDSKCDVDMNFVITGRGNFVEVQGTAEGEPFSKSDLDRMEQGARKAVEQIKKQQYAVFESLGIKPPV